MAHYLRDKKLRWLSINEGTVDQLCETFLRRRTQFSAIEGEPDETKLATFVIRFDNRGYKLYAKDQVLAYWRGAAKVERLVFSIDSEASLKSSRQNGSHMELRLDPADDNACWLVSSSDNQDWMDGSYWAIEDCLQNCKNHNGWLRAAWVPLATQVIGTLFVLAFCLWQAVKLAPSLKIESPSLVAFIVLFFFYLPV
jgi:hypothetical protein